jgi:cell division protein FtsA
MDLCDIIEPRVEEMLQMVVQDLAQNGYTNGMIANVVLTGGTALLEGIVELAEEVFERPVRRGVPAGIGGLVEVVSSPMYATSVGLLQFGVKQHHYGRVHKFSGDYLFTKIYHRMRDWFNEFLS